LSLQATGRCTNRQPKVLFWRKKLLPRLRETGAVQVVLCPPSVTLSAVQTVLSGTSLGLSAQNLHWEKNGAFTGEISASMLAGLCTHVIIGHSERRQYFGETDETVNKKIKAALAVGLTPIICVGENLFENESGLTANIVSKQVKAAYMGLTAEDVTRTIVAYEPIWAIGTGKTATPQYANQVIRDDVRGALAGLYGAEVASHVTVQYGGSVNAANALELLSQSDIDGALVGGASLKAADFVKIVQAAVEAKG
jgi:triosephosphate isomerase